MTPQVSVIVPVYGVEDCLPACLDSLAAQTLPDMEFILVDDGSPDGSGAICDAYAQRDPRFRVLHVENGGVGRARNAGLAVARGDYIGFADGDDLVEPDYYAVLVAAIEEAQADLAACNYCYLEDGATRERRCPMAPDRFVYQGDQAVGAFFTGVITPEIWNKLYRRALIEGLRFGDSIVHEDALFNFEALLRSRVTVYRDTYGYWYRVRGDSATRQRVTQRYVDDYLAAKERLLAMTAAQCPGYLPMAKQALVYALIRMICLVLDDGAAREMPATLARMRRRLSELAQDRAFRHSFTAAGQRKLFVMRHCPRLYAWLRRRRQP